MAEMNPNDCLTVPNYQIYRLKPLHNQKLTNSIKCSESTSLKKCKASKESPMTTIKKGMQTNTQTVPEINQKSKNTSLPESELKSLNSLGLKESTMNPVSSGLITRKKEFSDTSSQKAHLLSKTPAKSTIK
jgi:hypothetical protein